ncbi:hypothetical protein BCD48_40945 [Pseudofrankia sp. BMG5.36]|nr:hypothetical protein BCD48_40945 [Pseudofrankia sp. BMG5.36]
MGGQTYEVPAASVCSGIEIKPVYRGDDLQDFDESKDLGEPGGFPFTRGIHPTMYRTHLWSFRKYSGAGTSEETNGMFRRQIAAGYNALSVAFDLPTQLGYDPDHPKVEFDVGRVGVAISTMDDYTAMFDEIDIAGAGVNFTINAPAPIIYAMHLVLAERRGIPWEVLRGTIQNDPLKEFVARGNFVFPPQPAVRLACDVVEFARKHTPKFNAITFNQVHIKEAGATSAFALAASFVNAVEYIEEMKRRGYHIDDFGANMTFNLYGDMEFFENICQQRAARRLWAYLARDRFGAEKTRTMQFKYSGGGGSGTSLTRAHPLLNIARIAYHALTMALGGSQMVSVPAYDEAYAIPTEESTELCNLVSALVAYETGVTDVVDPLGGSYYVETLTDEIEAKIKEHMAEIESWGGAVASIESGALAREIARQSYAWARRIESGEDVVIGVNMFVPEHEAPIELFEYDPRTRDRQIARVQAVRERRDSAAVEQALAVLSTATEQGENVIPPLMDCVRVDATMGEMTEALVQVLGRFDSPTF